MTTEGDACAATVRWISPAGVERHEMRDVKALLERDDGFVWVDLPACDADAIALLSETFGFHQFAVRDCTARSHVPKLHVYPDTIFIVLNAPELGDAGHVHLLELDQFVGHRHLVTVHGPLGAGVPTELAMRETKSVGDRLDTGRFLPDAPAELAHAVVSAMTRHMETMTSDMATRIAALERRVMRNEMKDIAAMPLDALKQVAPLAGPAEQVGDLTQAGIGAVYDAIRSVNEQVGDIAKKLLGGGKSG